MGRWELFVLVDSFWNVSRCSKSRTSVAGRVVRKVRLVFRDFSEGRFLHEDKPHQGHKGNIDGRYRCLMCSLGIKR